MGLFDTITCQYPLPDPELHGAVFQTKSLANAMLRLTITADGRLLLHQKHWEPDDALMADASPDDSTGQGPLAALRLRGRYVDDGEVEIPYHGDIEMIPDRPLPGRERMGYRVRFTEGRVQWIRPTTDDDSRLALVEW